jgi:putative DNA primase/helicase|tara:strand:- start:899 stop:1129 length:231 start_codon:yes stop_codon:yes gene_type:complete
MGTAKHVVEALRGKWVGSPSMCCCPAHDDKNPSLSVYDADNKDGFAVHCFAGCDWKDIKDSLKARGLIEDSYGGRH